MLLQRAKVIIELVTILDNAFILYARTLKILHLDNWIEVKLLFFIFALILRMLEFEKNWVDQSLK